jgi:hypothetical protein
MSSVAGCDAFEAINFEKHFWIHSSFQIIWVGKLGFKRLSASKLIVELKMPEAAPIDNMPTTCGTYLKADLWLWVILQQS